MSRDTLSTQRNVLGDPDDVARIGLLSRKELQELFDMDRSVAPRVRDVSEPMEKERAP